MCTRVAILGGGVGGLSAAQELIDRGFDVTVYERKRAFGGKARSLRVPDTGSGERKDLPGEHGFRFFPAFYRHLPDTMKRIPFAGSHTVFDNLVTADRIEVARSGAPPIVLPARLPSTIDDWELIFKDLFSGIGIPADEVLFFVGKLFTLLTSSPERRFSEYERVPWWTFIEAESRSYAYQSLLGKGLTRSLVAVRAQDASTRTVGYIQLQLLSGAFTAGGFDRVLNGPTSDVWIEPWISHLSARGVQFQSDTFIRRIALNPSGVEKIIIDKDGQPSSITADYYISALPVEIMSDIVDDAAKAAAPSLSSLDKLHTEWMNGIQFYLSRDIPLEFGHTLYSDSPWAITSISQCQFWEYEDFPALGDGQVQGILSVDISDWRTPGINGKTAMQCSAEEVMDEVWAELKLYLNVGGFDVIRDEDRLGWFLDPDIQYPNPIEATNLEPLMVNTAGSLQFRPEASTEIPNLFLASDYVRTNTDVACMEAANEAARRAVNALLDRAGSTQSRVEVWPLHERGIFEPLIAYDRLRYRMGLPHVGSHRITSDDLARGPLEGQ